MTRLRPSFLAVLLLVLIGTAPFEGNRATRNLAAQSRQPAPRDPCAAPVNKVVAENCRPGNAREEWDVNGSGDPEIQGFATDMSVNVGGTIQFKIKTSSPRYRIDIYRTGWYGGQGARLVRSMRPSAALPQAQPDCRVHPGTRLVDCGNWAVSASWPVPADAASGVYLARLVREDDAPASWRLVRFTRPTRSTRLQWPRRRSASRRPQPSGS